MHDLNVSVPKRRPGKTTKDGSRGYWNTGSVQNPPPVKAALHGGAAGSWGLLLQVISEAQLVLHVGEEGDEVLVSTRMLSRNHCSSGMLFVEAGGLQKKLFSVSLW